MNDRTLELYKQAMDFAYTTIGKQHSDRGYFQAAVVGKYTELIIEECLKVASSQRNPGNLNYKPSERFVEELKQHFGVE